MAGNQNSPAEADQTTAAGTPPTEDGPLLPVLVPHPHPSHVVLYPRSTLARLRLVCHR